MLIGRSMGEHWRAEFHAHTCAVWADGEDANWRSDCILSNCIALVSLQFIFGNSHTCLRFVQGFLMMNHKTCVKCDLRCNMPKPVDMPIRCCLANILHIDVKMFPICLLSA